MTDDDPATEPPVRRAPIDRPPRSRADPAAMRETLDAARRRLGPDDSGLTAPSAERQRALLREAAASHAAPSSAGEVPAFRGRHDGASADPPDEDLPGEDAESDR